MRRPHLPATTSAALFSVLLIAAIVSAATFLVNNARDRALAGAKRELNNTSFILSEQYDQALHAVELVQKSVIRRIEVLGIASSEAFEREMSPQHVHAQLRDQISGLAHVEAFILLDANGKLLASSRYWPLPAINVGDRTYFPAVKSDPNQTTLLSVAAGVGTTNSATYLARKIVAPDGEPLGVLVGSMDLVRLGQLFSNIVLAEGAQISVFRTDGMLLARYPNLRKPAPSPPHKLHDFATNNETARSHVFSAHGLSHFPAVVVVSKAKSSIASSWLGEAMVVIGTAALACCLIAALAFRFARRLVHGRRQFQQKLDEQQLQLDVAISNMSQGLLLFDASTRVVIVNRRYIEMYGLSADVVKPGCAFRELIQHRKETGSFSGDFDRYCSDLSAAIAQGKIFSIVAETPSGRSIRIMNHPIAGGGWLATHEDITETQNLSKAREQAEQELRSQKLQLATALNNMLHGLCMFDPEGHIVLFNQRYIEMMGLSAERLLGCSLLDLLRQRKATGAFTGDPDLFYAAVLASVRAGKTTTKIVETVDGHALRVVDHPMPNGGWLATFEDITEQQRIERERDRNREFLDLIINTVPAAIFVKQASNRRYVLVNRAGERFWGISRAEMIGKTSYEVFPKEEADRITARDDELLQSDKPLFDERELLTPCDGIRSIASKRLIMAESGGQGQYVVGVVEDVTDQKIAERRIAHLAHHDGLTDLPNRVLLRERLEQELSFVRRGGRLAVLYLDLDHFKGVNDTLGHSAGDELLKAVTERLRARLRDNDIIARLGGDEFAIVQTGLEQPKDAAVLAQQLRDEIVRVPFELSGHQIAVDISIGIALAPNDGIEVDPLLKSADMALYGAKAEGRGTFRFFEPEMDSRMKARRALEVDLRKALSQGQFELYYQPVINIRDNRISGCEALLRWHHPERGMIAPAEFIPVAEETGLIIPIGEWVLRQACADAATWPADVKVAVNLSAAQFRNQALAQVVVRSLAAAGLQPSRLELEIVESVLMQSNEATQRTLGQLRELGIRIAMDDFGTGYSSLSYLRSFPFDKIKIDRSFIQDLSKSEAAVEIVEAILKLAQGLKMSVTAEGVETEPQLEVLRAIGCPEVQGYLFSRPLPVEKLTEFLNAHVERVSWVA